MVVLNLRDDCAARTVTNYRRERYYDGEQAIDHRRWLALDDDGNLVELKHLPNNRLCNNLYAKMVDQKTNYSFGRPFFFDAENRAYAEALNSVLGARFRLLLRAVGKGAWIGIGGVCWLYPYYEGGTLAFRRFPADEVLPFWADADHTILDAAIHVYVVQEYDETEQVKEVVKVEVLHGGGVDCFVRRDDGTLEPEDCARSGPYITFRDRCWTNKQALVNSINTNLTQMIIRGEAPDRAINAIAHQFGVAKDKAGRLVMTEAAAFSSAAQKDCYKDLEVEQYKVVATFDGETCPLCGDLDGKVFKQSDYQVGLTAPPFHPWCRCCTCPYFADMEGIGERWGRNADGTTTKVPADMTFDEWRKKFAQDSGLTENTPDDTLGRNRPKSEAAAVHYIGKLDKDLYRCVTQDITTDEVIITDERIQHIKDHHPGHFEAIAPYLKEAIRSPDYILEDAASTGLVLKHIDEQGLRLRIVLRLHTSTDPAGFKNSVLSAWKIREKEYDRLVRNKTVLYKRE